MSDPVLAASTFDDFVQALMQGIPVGAVYALIAVGFVLTYKTSGVFNLAFGAQAFASAAACRTTSQYASCTRTTASAVASSANASCGPSVNAR